jgi:serine/threonine protein kinase
LTEREACVLLFDELRTNCNPFFFVAFSESQLLVMTQPRPVAGFHSIIIREQDKDVYRKYQVIEVLGQGSMGSVSRVQVRSDRIGGSAVRHTQSMGLLGLLKGKRRTGKVDASHAHEYALKTVIVDRVSSTFLEELRNEIDILKTLDHPNIVRLHEVYSHRKQIYLILDLCERGDLYSRVPYSEREAAKFIGQLVSAITYMHQHGVVHRDLKFENIMFEDEETIKVIDFGLSKKFAGGVPEYMSERVGTIATMAPQVLQGIYSEKADSWSIGVIAFMMLGNRKPFYSKNRRQMVDWIMRAQYNFEGVMWGKVSEKGKDFVSRLLVVDPGVRMSPEMALRHEWLLQQEQWQDARPSIELLRKLDSSLYNYKHVLVIKKLALNVIAHRSTSEQIVELRRIFEEFDKNRNGVVTFDEFKSALAHSSLSEDALQEIFDSVVSAKR